LIAASHPLLSRGLISGLLLTSLELSVTILNCLEALERLTIAFEAP
jgi:hypothetical protein